MKHTKQISALAANTIRRGWTRGNLAKTEQDAGCWPASPEAAKWCMAGALMKASHDIFGDVFSYAHDRELMDSLYALTGNRSFAVYNDLSHTTPEKIISIFEAAGDATGETET